MAKKPQAKAAPAKAAASKAVPTKSASPPVRDPNAAPTEAQLVSHRKDRLAALTSQHRDVDNRMEVQKARVDDKQKLVDVEKEKLRELSGERAQVRTAIQHLAPGGYPMDEFDRSYTDMRLKTSTIDIERREHYRQEIRDVHGQPTLRQMEFDLERPRPEGANVLVAWRGRGYQDGILGEPCDPVKAGCPPEAIQEYNAGWGDGQAIIGRGFKLLKEAAPPPPPAGEIPGAPDWKDWPEDNKAWNVEQRERFCDWYETLDLDAVVEIQHAGAKAELARLDALQAAADGFEEQPEALAKQAGRPGGRTDAVLN